MAIEKIIEGRRCRKYNAGRVWVSEKGDFAAVDCVSKIGFSEIASTRRIQIHTDGSGNKYVRVKLRDRFCNILIKNAVYVCFCPPKPSNGKDYVVCCKDGNNSNLHYKNLELKEVVKTTRHTTADKVKLTNGLTVTKGGEVFYGKNKEYISDCVGDADTDLLRCIRLHVSDPNNMSGRLFMDDLIDAAGYVDGEKYSLKSPGNTPQRL